MSANITINRFMKTKKQKRTSGHLSDSEVPVATKLSANITINDV